MEKFLSNIAKACDSHIIGGGAPVADPLSGKSHNRAVICHRNGDIIGRYDKRVLFSSEQDARMPGAAEGIVELDGFRVGILICADLWDPALSRAMSGRVDVLAVGVKSSVPTEGHIKYARQLWHSMSLIRAMENGFALLVADWPEARHDFGRGEQGVRTRETHYTSGASTIVDPSHRPDLERIQKTIVPGRTGVLRADIRLEALDTFRDYRRRVGLLPPAPD
jgi:predicted amidohydrolase